jgi:hypothetical protein
MRGWFDLGLFLFFLVDIVGVAGVVVLGGQLRRGTVTF